MTATNQITGDAVPSKHFAIGPYRAELFSDVSGWAGVMNSHGVNCLTFKSKPGATVTDYETAKLIAEHWNGNN